jgi:hypothetical protein
MEGLRLQMNNREAAPRMRIRERFLEEALRMRRLNAGRCKDRNRGYSFKACRDGCTAVPAGKQGDSRRNAPEGPMPLCAWAQPNSPAPRATSAPQALHAPGRFSKNVAVDSKNVLNIRRTSFGSNVSSIARFINWSHLSRATCPIENVAWRMRSLG